MELDRCTHQDFLDILADLDDFWIHRPDTRPR
jgi:hypothetical protein